MYVMMIAVLCIMLLIRIKIVEPDQVIADKVSTGEVSIDTIPGLIIFTIANLGSAAGLEALRATIGVRSSFKILSLIH